MRDNTTTNLDRGPKGTDERAKTVESARMAVDAVNLHRKTNPADLPGRRPAHTHGLYLGGHLEARDGSKLFTSEIFSAVTPPNVIVRLSPMISGVKNHRLDLHGIAVRIQPGDTRENLTDLVALNTHPFMFRSADDFAMFLSRTQQGRRQLVIGFGAFGLGAIAGNASISGMANALVAMTDANRSLLGRRYWGNHTFFADHPIPENQKARIPYRYRLEIRSDGKSRRGRFRGKVLGRYRDIADRVRPDNPLLIDLVFMVPWTWERLADWSNVPKGIREQIINPIADWKNDSDILMATLVLDTVLDAEALHSGQTSEACDRLMFDPTRLSIGLYPSEDPLLMARSGVYAESHMRKPGHASR